MRIEVVIRNDSGIGYTIGREFFDLAWNSASTDKLARKIYTAIERKLRKYSKNGGEEFEEELEEEKGGDENDRSGRRGNRFDRDVRRTVEPIGTCGG